MAGSTGSQVSVCQGVGGSSPLCCVRGVADVVGSVGWALLTHLVLPHRPSGLNGHGPLPLRCWHGGREQFHLTRPGVVPEGMESGPACREALIVAKPDA